LGLIAGFQAGGLPYRLVVLSLLVVGIFPTASGAVDERTWQHRYCEGMELETHLPSGGYVDCLSDECAIEVDWSEHWAEAVGVDSSAKCNTCSLLIFL